MVCVNLDYLVASGVDPVSSRVSRIAAQDDGCRRLWPVNRAFLVALIDLGLTDGDIARYFRVSSRAVESLRRDFGLVRWPANRTVPASGVSEAAENASYTSSAGRGG